MGMWQSYQPGRTAAATTRPDPSYQLLVGLPDGTDMQRCSRADTGHSNRMVLERRAGRPAGEVAVEQDLLCVERRFEVHPGAVRVARAVVRLLCRAWQLGEVCESAVLVISELSANAVRHGATGGMILRLRLSTRRLRIELADNSPGRPEVRRPPDEAESGRGMWLVSVLSVRWGVEPDPIGKRTWAELSIPV